MQNDKIALIKNGGQKTSETRASYGEEFKKNAVKLSYAPPKSVKRVAEDLEVSEKLLCRWQRKWTPDGDETRYATIEEENKAFKLELAELKMGRNMLKKGHGLLREPAQVKYRFIKEHDEHPVAKWVEFFQVSRSGYYAYMERRSVSNVKWMRFGRKSKALLKKSTIHTGLHV